MRLYLSNLQYSLPPICFSCNILTNMFVQRYYDLALQLMYTTVMFFIWPSGVYDKEQILSALLPSNLCSCQHDTILLYQCVAASVAVPGKQ